MTGLVGKSLAAEGDVLKAILWGTTFAGISRNDAVPLTVLYLALHTADPTEAGNQASSECTYTGYARVAVNRDNTGFSISGAVATLVADANFPLCTAGSETATFFTLGTAASGAGEILYGGPITPTITINNGITPTLTAGTSITEG